MKKGLILFTFLAFLSGCSWFATSEKKIEGSGVPAIEERTVSAFDEIEVHGQGILIFKQSDKPSLSIEADDNLLEYIETSIRGDTLKISFKDGVSIESRTLIKYYVGSPTIKEIELQGSVQCMSDGIVANSLEIEATGFSKVDAVISVKKLKVEGSGSTKFNLMGTAQEQTLKLTGSSLYNAGELISEKIELDASGSVRVTIFAEKELKAQMSGAVFIGYKGEPMLNIKQSGAASISKVG